MKSKSIITAILLLISMAIIDEINGQVCGTCNGSITTAGNGAGTQGTENSFFGSNAGASTTSGGIANSFFGERSGEDNTTGDHNSFFGKWAGLINDTGSSNSYFGNLAGVFNSAGSDNVCIGDSTGFWNTSSLNTFVGSKTGHENTVGEQNSYFGAYAGHKNTTGKQNTFLGSLSGFSNAQGQRNSLIGNNAGFNNVNGSHNTYIGYNAGYSLTNTSSNNVVIGSNAGPSSTLAVNDKLYIDNEATDHPLIYAEFDNDHVIINGTFEATAGQYLPSSRTLKNKYTKLNASAVLAKISMMDIQEWSYISHPDQRHIGPIAEEFHEAFGLGRDNKSISTVDASGVALVAIQALHKENEKLKEENKVLKASIESIEERLMALEKEQKH